MKPERNLISGKGLFLGHSNNNLLRWVQQNPFTLFHCEKTLWGNIFLVKFFENEWNKSTHFCHAYEIQNSKKKKGIFVFQRMLINRAWKFLLQLIKNLRFKLWIWDENFMRNLELILIFFSVLSRKRKQLWFNYFKNESLRFCFDSKPHSLSSNIKGFLEKNAYFRVRLIIEFPIQILSHTFNSNISTRLIIGLSHLASMTMLPGATWEMVSLEGQIDKDW